MGTGRTDEFRKDAVRIALTCGLTRRQVADDLGLGLSTMNKWVNAHRDTDVASTIHVEGTQHWVGKARSPSNGKWLKRALGAAQIRDRSSASPRTSLDLLERIQQHVARIGPTTKTTLTRQQPEQLDLFEALSLQTPA